MNRSLQRFMEGNRSWWGGRASNPVGGVSRSRVGSTPIFFRHILIHDYSQHGDASTMIET